MLLFSDHYTVQWILRLPHLNPKCFSPSGSSFTSAKKQKTPRKQSCVRMCHSRLKQGLYYLKINLFGCSLDKTVEWRHVALRARLIESPDWDGWSISAALLDDLTLWLSGSSHPLSWFAIPSVKQDGSCSVHGGQIRPSRLQHLWRNSE